MPTDEMGLLYEKIKTLNEHLWEGRADRPTVDLWLGNFTGSHASPEEERHHALYLLSKFLYFGQSEIRQLLRAMFQDLVRHPLSVEARDSLGDKADFDCVHSKFLEELNRTRFLGLGNPAESGTHILYDFRLVNQITLDLFVSPHDLFTGALNKPGTRWAFPKVHRLIFIDDFCGSGSQAVGLGQKLVPLMREVASISNVEIEVWYLTLLATTQGLTNVKRRKLFDNVESVSELDDTYRVFGANSQMYVRAPNGLDKTAAEGIARHYGRNLQRRHPLGFRDSQLMLGFHHNIPNNTLPIFSRERRDPPWHPIFPRFEKYS